MSRFFSFLRRGRSSTNLGDTDGKSVEISDDNTQSNRLSLPDEEVFQNNPKLSSSDGEFDSLLDNGSFGNVSIDADDPGDKEHMGVDNLFLHYSSDNDVTPCSSGSAINLSEDVVDEALLSLEDSNIEQHLTVENENETRGKTILEEKCTSAPEASPHLKVEREAVIGILPNDDVSNSLFSNMNPSLVTAVDNSTNNGEGISFGSMQTNIIVGEEILAPLKVGSVDSLDSSSDNFCPILPRESVSVVVNNSSSSGVNINVPMSPVQMQGTIEGQCLIGDFTPDIPTLRDQAPHPGVTIDISHLDNIPPGLEASHDNVIDSNEAGKTLLPPTSKIFVPEVKDADHFPASYSFELPSHFCTETHQVNPQTNFQSFTPDQTNNLTLGSSKPVADLNLQNNSNEKLDCKSPEEYFSSEDGKNSEQSTVSIVNEQRVTNENLNSGDNPTEYGNHPSSCLYKPLPDNDPCKREEICFLNVVSFDHVEAEARLAQRRAARAEARELRLKELERIQKEQGTEDDEDVSQQDSPLGYATPDIPPSRTSSVPRSTRVSLPSTSLSRRSSEDSLSDDALPGSTRELKAELKELQEKFRSSMISNAQLDNEKSTLTYEVDYLKDKYYELEESHTQITKEHRRKCSEAEQLKKITTKLREEVKILRRLLQERDEMIQEYGLVVAGEEENGDAFNSSFDDLDDPDRLDETVIDLSPRKIAIRKALLSQEASDLLKKGAAKGSLDVRLKKYAEEKNMLEDEVQRLRLELEEQFSIRRKENGLDHEKQKEANKSIHEYKFRVQKAEAEVSTLQANVARLESLVSRYKASTVELEKSEEELKQEKRKLQRELREAQNRLEELEVTASHLQKRFDKLKNARSNLLKDLSLDPPP